MRLIFGPEHNITLGLEATLTAYRVFGKRLRAEYVPLSPDCPSAEPCMDVLVRTGVGAASAGGVGMRGAAEVGVARGSCQVMQPFSPRVVLGVDDLDI